MKIIFWLSLFIVFYTFAGYGILLYMLIRIKRIIKGKRPVPVIDDGLLPDCTLVVAAYNEDQFISEKINNTLNLNYPAGKIKFYFYYRRFHR